MWSTVVMLKERKIPLDDVSRVNKLETPEP